MNSIEDLVNSVCTALYAVNQAAESLARASHDGIRAIEYNAKMPPQEVPNGKPESGEDPAVAACMTIKQSIHENPDRLMRDCIVIHATGARYKVRGVSLREKDCVPLVSYQGTELLQLPDGTEMIPTWTRPLDDFLSESQLPDGTKVHRFRAAEAATEYPPEIMPRESPRDSYVPTPPPGHSITAGVDPEPGGEPAPARDEQVMCIKLDGVCWEGLKMENAREWLDRKIINTPAIFLRRDLAEKDFEHKQVIPYIAIRCGTRFAVFRRVKGSGENRLLGKLTLGLGGHVELERDGDQEAYFNHEEKKVFKLNNLATINKAVTRELNEEAQELPPDFQIRFSGIINLDEADEVSRVHIGLFFQINLTTPVEFGGSEGMIFEGWWQPQDIHKRIEEFEPWSKVLIEGEIVPSANYSVA